MSVAACADMVEKGDPGRFLSALSAPSNLRGRLMVLYAFNLEIARAPWVTSEAMIAQIRLQWWLDVLDEIASGAPPRAHPVVGALADLVNLADLDIQVFRDLVQARKFDIGKDPHVSVAAFEAYIDATSGGLMWQAAKALGAAPTAETTVRQFGFGVGVANMLGAFGALSASGRQPLVDRSESGVKSLVMRAKTSLRLARRGRNSVPRQCGAALRAGWQADRILTVLGSRPERLLDGDLRGGEFQRKARLLWRSSTGRW